MHTPAKWISGILLVTATFAGCGKGGDLPNPSSSDPLIQRQSTQDALQSKYNQVTLSCELWVQYGSELSRSTPSNDKFSWDLIHDFTTGKTFTLNAKVHNQTLSFTVIVQALNLEDSIVTDVDGTVYRMQNSPVVKLEYQLKEWTLYEGNQSTQVSATGRRDLRERIPDRTWNESYSMKDEPFKYFNYVECVIATDIKPEFRNQFLITPANPE